MSNEIQQALENSIQAGIVAALGGTEVIVRKMVGEILSEKVTEHGGKPSYSNEAKYTYLEWLTTSTIREAVKLAFVKMVTAQTDELEKMVSAQLQQDSDGLARALVTGLTKHLKVSGDYRINIEIKREDE